MEITEFIDDLGRGVESDPWEPTDTGYHLLTKNYDVSLRRSDDSSIQLLVEDRDGREIMKASQKLGPEGVADDVTVKLSFLYQSLGRKPIDSVAALDDVVRELHTGRSGRADR